MSKVSFVVLTHNEEATISRRVEAIRMFLSRGAA